MRIGPPQTLLSNVLEGARWGPDGQTLAVTGPEGIQLLDLGPPLQVRHRGDHPNATHLALSGDSDWIATENQNFPPDIPPGLPSTLLERRPDIMEAEQYVAAQNAMIGVAQAMRFPSFNLTALFGVASPDLTFSAASAAWSGSGTILGPIFNFGKNKRRVEIERYKTEQAYYSYDQTVLQAFRETEDALVAVSTYRDELIAVLRQRIAAENAAMLSRARYDEGITSYLEVLDSERTLFDASLNASATMQYR